LAREIGGPFRPRAPLGRTGPLVPDRRGEKNPDFRAAEKKHRMAPAGIPKGGEFAAAHRLPTACCGLRTGPGGTGPDSEGFCGGPPAFLAAGEGLKAVKDRPAGDFHPLFTRPSGSWAGPQNQGPTADRVGGRGGKKRCSGQGWLGGDSAGKAAVAGYFGVGRGVRRNLCTIAGAPKAGLFQGG